MFFKRVNGKCQLIEPIILRAAQKPLVEISVLLTDTSSGEDLNICSTDGCHTPFTGGNTLRI